MGSADSKTFRFAVGTPDYPLSWTWRLWVHGDDIYLGAREGLRAFKVSLHRSGVWRVALVNRLEKDTSTDRVIVKWQRPPELVPGWIPSVVVLVSSLPPAQPITPKKIDDRRVTWISAPSSGKKIFLRIFLSQPGVAKESLTLGRDRLFGGLSTKSGVKAWLLVQEEPLTSIEIGKIEEFRSKLKLHVSAMPKPGSGFTPRGLLLVSDDEPTERTQPTLYDIMLGGENIEIDTPAKVTVSFPSARARTDLWFLRL